MDRYVIRDKRMDVEHRQGNQRITISGPGSGGNPSPANIYNINYDSQAMHQDAHYIPQFGSRTTRPPNIQLIYQNEGQAMSGIDTQYLSSLSDNSTSFVPFGQVMQSCTSPIPETFGSNYQRRSFTGPERNVNKTYVPQRTPYVPPLPRASENSTQAKNITESKEKQTVNKVTPKKPAEVDLSKSEVQHQVKTRSEKLKELHKIGTRIFSGPVEKILKWNKSVQDVGAMIMFEIVGKCVSVRPGETCAKNLVVRDENGPAMQVVYYEIDFLLPEISVPCMIRVIGRMMPSSSRFQAFSVRPATGDDVATLPRRAAVSAHHVTKLCGDYA